MQPGGRRTQWGIAAYTGTGHVQQNILRILTAEIANLLRPPKLQSGVLKNFWKGIFGLLRLMLHATKLRLPNFYK